MFAQSSHTPRILAVLISITTAVALAYSPFSSASVDGLKWSLTAVGTAVLSLLLLISVVKHKKITFVMHPIMIAIMVYLLTIVQSLLRGVPFFIDGMTTLYGFNLLLICAAMFATILLAQQDTFKDAGKTWVWSLTALAVILAILSVLQTLGLGISSFFTLVLGISLDKSPAFSVSGSALTTLTLYLPVIAALITQLFIHRAKRPHLLTLAACGGVVFATLFLFFQMFVQKSITVLILPIQTHWSIITDTAKSLVVLARGVGPERFQDAFTLLKPVTFNSTSQWNVIFQTGTNAPLTDLISIGVFGCIAWMVIFLYQIVLYKKTPTQYRPLAVLTLTASLLQLLLPANPLLLTVQWGSFCLWIVSLHHHHVLRSITIPLSFVAAQQDGTHHKIDIPAYVVAGGIGVFFCSLFLLTIQYTKSQWYLFQSGLAAHANDGTRLYSTQKKMVDAFPYKDTYRLAYAQTNLAVATSLSKKEDLTAEQRQTIARLLQQSIREAKLATQLNPGRSLYWQALGNIYKNLIGSVKQADQWTIAAYVKAIETHPHNPLLRIELGQVFFQQKNYQQAANLFTQAIQLKPDFATGYFALGQTLSVTKNHGQAAAAYQQALKLLSPQSENYLQVESALQKELESAKTASAAASLKTPVSAPTETELPEELKKAEDAPETALEGLTLNPPTATPSAQPDN